MQKAILGSNLSNKCVKKIFFGEFYQINGIESSPNIGSIKLRTNLKHKVYVTNVALLIRYITSFENKQQQECCGGRYRTCIGQNNLKREI